jgi:hypothetical protein
MSNKYLFISDYIQEIGGAEMVDSRLREFLGGEQIVLRCADCTIEKLSKYKNYKVIISNFTVLQESCKDYIAQNMQYIIWEHDHKYLRTRNPSIFKDFIAPKDQIINLHFYKKAKAVVCQTKQHLDVIYLNTKLNNLVNYGGSIWSSEQLDLLEVIYKDKWNDPRLEEQEKTCGILDSEIIHKGTRQSVAYCEKNGLKYNLLSLKDWKDFIFDLSKNDSLVFFPQVLETCSRIAVEARMLGLRVIGSGNISAIKEDWFQNRRGIDLINYFREKNKNIPNFVEKCFNLENKIEEKPNAEVTVILNLYKRPQNLQKQIDAIRNQSIKPKEIWVWQNYADEVKSIDQLSINGVDKWITSCNNWKFIGRFAMAQLVQTEYVALFDDDTIPGVNWFENCLDTMKIKPGIMGGIGVVLHSDENYHEHHRFGWATPEHQQIEEVDLVGHAWFLRKEHLKYMWHEEPYSYENFEDGHLSAMAQKYGKIKTYVPIQNTRDNTCSQFGYELGVDSVASSVINPPEFYKERNEAVKHYCSNGWKRVLGK